MIQYNGSKRKTDIVKDIKFYFNLSPPPISHLLLKFRFFLSCNFRNNFYHIDVVVCLNANT